LLRADGVAVANRVEPRDRFEGASGAHEKYPQKKVDCRKIFEVTSCLRAYGMNDIPPMQQNILTLQ